MKSGRTGGPPGNIFSRFVDGKVDIERPVAFLAASRILDWHAWIFSRGERQPGPERIASRMNFIVCAVRSVASWLPPCQSQLDFFHTVEQVYLFPALSSTERGIRKWKEDGFVRDLVARIFTFIATFVFVLVVMHKDWNKNIGIIIYTNILIFLNY